jgi:hypothetical protein
MTEKNVPTDPPLLFAIAIAKKQKNIVPSHICFKHRDSAAVSLRFGSSSCWQEDRLVSNQPGPDSGHVSLTTTSRLFATREDCVVPL